LPGVVELLLIGKVFCERRRHNYQMVCRIASGSRMHTPEFVRYSD